MGCGPLRRRVTYPSAGIDTENLQASIVQAFGNLTGILSTNIALLQIKSFGEYMDVLSPSQNIPDNSFVKVVTYKGVS